MAVDDPVQPRPRNFTALGGTPEPAWLDVAAAPIEDLPFSGEEYRRRLDAVRDTLSGRGLAAVLVLRPSSVEYLSGYHSAETAPQPLLVTGTDTRLYVPDLELGRALVCCRADSVGYFGYAQAPRALPLIAQDVARLVADAGPVAVESAHTCVPPELIELLRQAGVEVVPGDNLVERLRLTLSPAEIACVEQAALLTQRGVEAAVDAARRPAATDSSVAAAVAEALIRDADSRSAWGPVVATGKRAGIAHSSWTRVPLGDEASFLEFSGTHHRYHAPVMRTLVRGDPSPRTERLASLSREALDAVLGTAKAGVSCAEVAHAAIEAISPLPPDVVFHNVFGYPIGIAHPPHWMDGAPFYISTDNPGPLREGMVFHMPGSFRTFAHGGVGLSQTFVVEKTGSRVLTHGPAELIGV
jgi:Xaa-Pro dipeptidase